MTFYVNTENAQVILQPWKKSDIVASRWKMYILSEKRIDMMWICQRRQFGFIEKKKRGSHRLFHLGLQKHFFEETQAAS